MESTDMNSLCRLCAKNDEYSKDLLDKSNTDLVILIKEWIQITVEENDRLPTKICINCEEKMVSFHLFVLECTRVQDALKEICLTNFTTVSDKEESDTVQIIPLVKSEIKLEYTEAEITDDIRNVDDDDAYDNFTDDIKDDSSLLEEIAIASVRKKKKTRQNESLHEKEVQEDIKNALLKVKDFVKMICISCGVITKNWTKLSEHCEKKHKCKAFAYCICGFRIKSKNMLYKHVSSHKVEAKVKSDHDEVESETVTNKSSKDLVKFICNYCKEECSSWYSLQAHSSQLHEASPVVQCACGVLLKSKSVLYKHIADHKDESLFRCDKCPKRTKSLSAMEKHMIRHIPKEKREYKCATCNKLYTSKDALKSHIRSHIPIEERKVYKCDDCDLRFTTRASALSHKKVVHDKIKGYVCDLCGYACGTNGELKQHRAIHSEDKPFTCPKCNKPFKTYSNLKTHMDTHEDTSYVCYVCSRVLNSRRTLRKHLLVHDTQFRHVCSYCNKAFKRRQTLKVHMSTHTGDKPLSCQWCTERFAYASTLRSHRLRFHPDKMSQHQAHHNSLHPSGGGGGNSGSYIYDVPETRIVDGDCNAQIENEENVNVCISKIEMEEMELR